MKTSKYKALIATPLALAAIAGASLLGVSPALADVTPSVDLGQATDFSILGGSSVGNTGAATLLQKSLGVAPGSTITGFPTVQVQGSIENNTPRANQARADAKTAYDFIASSGSTATAPELGGQTFRPGAVKVPADATVNGTVTLDGQGVYIFQIPNRLSIANAASIKMVNGATSCDVYWQVGDSASVGSSATVVGSLLVANDASLGAGTSLEGRLLSDSGAVTLNNNVITAPNCTGVPTVPVGSGPGPVVADGPPASDPGTPVDNGPESTGNSGSFVGGSSEPLAAPSSNGGAVAGGGSPANASASDPSASSSPSALATEQLAQTGTETAPWLHGILGVVFGGIVMLGIAIWRGRNKPQEN